MLEIPESIIRTARKLYARRWFRWVVRITAMVMSLLLGGVLYATLFADSELTEIQRIIALSTVLGGLLTGGLFLLIAVFRLELLVRQIQREQNVAEREVTEWRQIGTNIGNKVAMHAYRTLASHGTEVASVFSERQRHYEAEKEFIADYFLKDVLANRVAKLRQERPNQPLRIFFDSGSTIAPMLNQLGKQASDSVDHWSKTLLVVTNNMQGVEHMLRYRADGDRYANLSVPHFYVLPGEILAPYEAVADPDTIAAIERFSLDEAYTIVVTTGNYLFFLNDVIVPIARAGYHPNIKVTLHSIADEIYLAAPLGKLLGRESGCADLGDMLRDFNNDLALKQVEASRELAEKAYRIVDESLVLQQETVVSRNVGCIENWLSKTVLLTTSRPDNALLHDHFSAVQSVFPGAARYRDDWVPGEGPYWYAPEFRNLPLRLEDQLKIELPHEILRPHAPKYFKLSEAGLSMWKEVYSSNEE